MKNEQVSFKQKALIVSEQYDKWNIPFALLARKDENIYALIERLHETLSKHEVKGDESYNQWVARTAAECYPHYVNKMGGKLNNNHHETMKEREERYLRYKEHQAKFYDTGSRK